MDIIIYSHANKTHLYKVVHLAYFENEGFWNSEVAYSNAFSLRSLMYKNTPILARITLIHLWKIDFVSVYNNHVYF